MSGGEFCEEVIDFIGLIHVTVSLKASQNATENYETDFLIDTGATDCLAPA